MISKLEKRSLLSQKSDSLVVDASEPKCHQSAGEGGVKYRR